MQEYIFIENINSDDIFTFYADVTVTQEASEERIILENVDNPAVLEYWYYIPHYTCDPLELIIRWGENKRKAFFNPKIVDEETITFILRPESQTA